MARKAAFHNLGCRVNSYETEAMMELLRAAGYEIVPFAPGADVYVINTCTVTNIADRKSRQMLHRAKQMNPEAVVAAVGCYVEDGRERLTADPAVDLIVGNAEKSKLAELLEEHFREAGLRRNHDTEAGMVSAREDTSVRTVRSYENLAISEAGDRVRAFIKIQDGCNMFCTYCVIPYVRGRVRSRDPQDVLEEAERLARAGYKELILTGIHIGSYGMDFRSDPPGMTLLALVKRVCAIPGVRRVRFGSLEPGIMTEAFVRELSSLPEICPQFHLSLQSGCDATLRRMKRHYTTGEYTEICERLRRYFPDPAITTDVIVGFPGETEEEFRESASFAETTGFARIHIFKYSRRDGTKAASMSGQVPEPVKARRAAVLAGIEADLRRTYLKRIVGKECEVLVEEMVRTRADGAVLYRGHTREAADALLASESDRDLTGQIIRACAAGVSDDLNLLFNLSGAT